MELTTGQLVRVREDLIPGEYYGDTYFNSDMKKYCGKLFRVGIVFGLSECHFVDDERWYWNKLMLEPAPAFESGDTKAILKVEIFGVGKVGDIITLKAYDGNFYLTKEHLPMQGTLSANDAEIIKEE